MPVNPYIEPAAKSLRLTPNPQHPAGKGDPLPHNANDGLHPR